MALTAPSRRTLGLTFGNLLLEDRPWFHFRVLSALPYFIFRTCLEPDYLLFYQWNDSILEEKSISHVSGPADLILL